MKLLYCPKCQDIKKLQYRRRECKCGSSWGWYEKNGWHAVVGGECVPLGINNFSLEEELIRGDSYGRTFLAFVINSTCKTVERMGDNPKEHDEFPPYSTSI